ncbi:4126_t:CDS:10 [Funneliformis caledonium]|uniref:ubiquitinyl hydrolase 1 n=1 Tax=Funneliformis caledonium TaxID=1117310 RepID=A0A9N8VC48_9GLOM|nr:4126_t:CDS:10 [Funneliformis caledonium]
MSSIKVVVTWSGKNFDLEIEEDDSVDSIKAKMFSLTSVEPYRQRLLFKGKLLTESSDLSTLNIKEGSKLMMMGTTGELPTEPKERTLFYEDMTDKQLAETLKLPSGLENLGNTCYMNATLQCLRAIPELQESLNSFTGRESDANILQRNLTTSLRDLYHQMDQTTGPSSPQIFLEVLRSAFPQFAQRNAHGFMQQDADECWSQIITSLNQANVAIPKQDPNSSSIGGSFIDRYMKGEFTSTLKCLEDPDEAEVVTKEEFFTLKCHITVQTNFMQNGIMQGLDEKIEKNSPTLGRMATYSKSLRVNRLPAYLTVQFVRFYWKTDRNIKILRKVKFPMELDVTDICTDELKNKTLPLRNSLLELEKERASSKRKAKLAANDSNQNTTDSKIEETTNVEELEKLKKLIDPELAKDVGANVSGLYDLCAALTHIGRSTDSGHYIGWVRKENSGT